MGKLQQYYHSKHYTFPCFLSTYTRVPGFDCFFIFQDMNNFESDPEDFARTFCKDLAIDDPEVGVSKADNYTINFLPLSPSNL